MALSLHIFSEEEIQYVKVEVAAVIWKNQMTTESFEKVEEYTLANEILALEKAEEPQINLETIELPQGQIKIDLDYIEEIFFDDYEVAEEDEVEIIKPPRIYRVIDKKEHELMLFLINNSVNSRWFYYLDFILFSNLIVIEENFFNIIKINFNLTLR